MSDVRGLFDDEPAPWEIDDAELASVATVVFADGAPGEYDYLVPDKLQGEVKVGQRITVPIGRGNRPAIGYCVRFESKRVPRPLKSILSIVDASALISREMLQLTEWMSEEYLCPWGRALETVIPAAVRGNAGTHEAIFYGIDAAVISGWQELQLPTKQKAILEKLASATEPVWQQELLDHVGCTVAPLKSLLHKGLIHAERKRVWRSRVGSRQQAQPDLELNDDQRRAVDRITDAVRSNHATTFLLFGVTGSGKTEVYIRAIQEVIRMGRQAIVLVPEISLTPQTVRRFQARFDRVAILHSHLSPAERNWHWQQIAAGDVDVVVGARSAVFAPTPRLGLIVLDEEHDQSFKQDQVPRYHARDVAIKRTSVESVPLILGSATPSMESWERAVSRSFQLMELPRRVYERPLPHVGTIDLRLEYKNRYQRGAISRPLQQAMQDALRDGGQVILLLNRRGHATHVQCPACGGVVRCRNCDIALTYHRTEEVVVCHYCDYQAPAPARCLECRFEGIQYSGLGTERLEEEVKAKFPHSASLRMDSDTMKRPGSHAAALDKFRSGDVRILLGTQMIAKGLDFPNVTLVGVINADTGLHIPDFRAAERTFQLVTQVAGRTGRGDQGGRVLVQSFNPEHYAIEAATEHDFRRFVGLESAHRRPLGYPPFGFMVRVIFRGVSQVQTQAFAQQFGEFLQRHWVTTGAKVRQLGPAPAPIARLRGCFRFHLLLQGTDRKVLRQGVRSAERLKPPDEVQWLADIDPFDML